MDSSKPDPSPQDVNDILKRKRKVREHKACYPCRKRKVRCDSNVPCKTCVERNHADLCTFNPPNKRRDSGDTHGDDLTHSGTMVIPKSDWDRVCMKLSGVERALADLKDDLRHMNGETGTSPDDAAHSPGSSLAMDRGNLPPPTGPGYVKAMEINEHNHMTGENVHLGGGSIPALINALGKGDDYSKKVKSVFGNSSNMLPVFGLDNESATYPFVSLWGYQEASTRVAELRKVLPGDAECLETFRQYRDGAHVTYPAIPNIEIFETDLLTFLQNRRLNDTNMQTQISNDQMDGMSVRWVGLLFAVFASGAQFSALPKKDRELLSQVYACCSFECLRLVNYLANASLEIVQTLLILGNVLSNGMNAGAAWALLGLTLRLARSLGCHTASERAANSPADLTSAKIWWAVLWQDSLLSISYDRATSTATPDTPFPPPESRSGRDGLTFTECMHRIAKVGLLTVRNRVAMQSIESRLVRCVDLREEIQRTRDAAADHLRDVRSSRSIRDQCEYWTLYLHASYMTSELCRPAISPGTSDFDKGSQLRRTCIAHLLNTVDAFTGLANSSPIHTRTWAVVHRALSAALLLGILGEPLRNPRAQQLLRQLITIMRDGVGFGQGEELSAPVSRSISALNKLSAPESITPRNMEEQVAVDAKPAPLNLAGMLGNGNVVDDNPNGLSTELPEFDESAFFLPTPLAGFEDESSPYALMDSIIWGGGGKSMP